MDSAGARADAVARGIAGGFSLVAGLWLLLVAEHAVQYMFAVAALVFGALWLRRQRRTPSPAEDFLELSPSGLRLSVAGSARYVSWSETRAVALDHDRLQIKLLFQDDSSLSIEPGYGALPMRELAETIDEYRRHGHPCIPPQDG